jgi:predicted RNase H-like nuclease (RuvC/YqgF family)
MAGATEKVSQFSDVAKAGSAGALGFKLGLVGLAATIGAVIGKAIGDVIFDTAKWERAMASAKEEAKALDDQVKKLDVHVKSLEQEFWTKNDPEKKARSESMTGQLTAAIEELESKIQRASGTEKANLESELATKKAWLAVLN